MKIAVPLHKHLTLYHGNPRSAPKFGIYSIEGNKHDLTFKLVNVVSNPWHESESNTFDETQSECSCDIDLRRDLHHIGEHYVLLEAIGGCSYLLADHCCENMARTMKNGGVKIFKIPPIINSVDKAIKNFIIGAKLASTVKHIHHAS